MLKLLESSYQWSLSGGSIFWNNLNISMNDWINNNKKQKGTDNSAIHEGRLSKLPVVLPLNKES